MKHHVSMMPHFNCHKMENKLSLLTRNLLIPENTLEQLTLNKSKLPLQNINTRKKQYKKESSVIEWKHLSQFSKKTI